VKILLRVSDLKQAADPPQLTHSHRVKILLRVFRVNGNTETFNGPLRHRLGLGTFQRFRSTLIWVFRSPSSGIATRLALSSAFGVSNFHTDIAPSWFLLFKMKFPCGTVGVPIVALN
jgi:hypothetical protein